MHRATFREMHTGDPGGFAISVWNQRVTVADGTPQLCSRPGRGASWGTHTQGCILTLGLFIRQMGTRVPPSLASMHRGSRM